MQPMKQARSRMKGHWLAAEGILFAKTGMRLFVFCIQFLLLRVSGLGAERVTTARDVYNGQWLYAAILFFTLVLDWLLVSPLLLGETDFYYRLAQESNAPLWVAFSFYRRGYIRALRWRLGLFWRRLLWIALGCFPPAAAMGYAAFIRLTKDDSSAADMELQLCTMLGLLLFAAGVLACELLMMRFLPASLLLTADRGQEGGRRLFRRSRRIMRSHVGEMLWLYMRFSLWLFSCVLIVPYAYAAPLFYAARADRILYFASHPCPSRKKAPHRILTALEMTQELR